MVQSLVETFSVVASVSWLAVVAFLLLVPFRRLRWSVGIGLWLATAGLGAFYWLWSSVIVYGLWGGWALLAGWLLCGVGVVPLAVVALLFAGDGGTSLVLVASVSAVLGIRVLAGWCLTSHERDVGVTTAAPSVG